MLHFQIFTSDKQLKKRHILTGKTFKIVEALVSAAPPVRMDTFRKI